MSLLPSMFISHGAPTLVLEDAPARRFLSGFAGTIDKPRAIVAVSAHWLTDEVRVLGNAAPETVHDFSGFPAPLYDLRYPAAGAGLLAGEIRDTLAKAGFEAELDLERGYDHGVWMPLQLMFPAADIPVTQVSINPHKSPLYHWRLGRALAGLRAKGVLVMGSGSMTHNLQDFRALRADSACPAVDYAEAFTEWVAGVLAAGDLDALLGYRQNAPEAVRAHPTDEHLLPLFTALGAAGVAWNAQRVHHSFMHGVIAMDSYLFNSSSGASRGTSLH